MHHIIFNEAPTYNTAILIKYGALKKQEMERHYVNPLTALGVPSTDTIGFSLKFNEFGKCTAKQGREYLSNLLPALDNLQVKNLFVCDAHYFKLLTGVKKADPNYGYSLPCVVKGHEHFNIILGTNYNALFYNPDLQDKLNLALKTVFNKINGIDFTLGAGIIHSEEYPESLDEIEAALNKLHAHPELTLDLEAFSLKFWKAGIGTVGFSWDEHNGISFPCDYAENKHVDTTSKEDFYGHQISNKPVKALLKTFLQNYKGRLIYHNGNYDIKVLIYELYMEDPLDTKGMLEGIEELTRSFDDTKLITYLATNTTAGNKLSLKEVAHKFAGNWGQSDIEDIRKIPKKELLRYNLVDCLSTWYARERYYQKMCDDDQLSVYQKIFIPSVKVILQMELTGMPTHRPTVLKAKAKLEAIQKKHKTALMASPTVVAFQQQLRNEEFIKQNLLWVNKKEPIDFFNKIVFNPGSNPQLQRLLYEVMGYPVLDRTKTKQPAVGGKTIRKLLARSTCKEHTEIFENLIELADVSKILSTFIKAFIEHTFLKADGLYYLHGNFNLGGTVSGRLSSSKPNMQNIPSTGSQYAKIIKACFVAPPGWIMCGADFASLEDRVSALTTRDPNKIKVYTDGYDGHCLRAYAYFGSSMPDIVNTVTSINSITTAYPDLRQDSKGPTFLLTYMGTWHGMVKNLGFEKGLAKKIEANYHSLYTASDEWVAGKIEAAAKDGYVTVAFGLRVRTPILSQTLLGRKSTPYEASAESRTAGNALGQSYGMLNNRAGIEFQSRTLASDYRLDVLPIAQIHDAGYYLVRDNINCMEWFNINLVECMQWQDLPEIQHDVVKLGGNTEIYYPTWATTIKLPNNATQQQILTICKGKNK